MMTMKSAERAARSRSQSPVRSGSESEASDDEVSDEGEEQMRLPEARPIPAEMFEQFDMGGVLAELTPERRAARTGPNFKLVEKRGMRCRLDLPKGGTLFGRLHRDLTRGGTRGKMVVNPALCRPEITDLTHPFVWNEFVHVRRPSDKEGAPMLSPNEWQTAALKPELNRGRRCDLKVLVRRLEGRDDWLTIPEVQDVFDIQLPSPRRRKKAQNDDGDDGPDGLRGRMSQAEVRAAWENRRKAEEELRKRIEREELAAAEAAAAAASAAASGGGGGAGSTRKRNKPAGAAATATDNNPKRPNVVHTDEVSDVEQEEEEMGGRADSSASSGPQSPAEEAGGCGDAASSEEADDAEADEEDASGDENGAAGEADGDDADEKAAGDDDEEEDVKEEAAGDEVEDAEDDAAGDDESEGHADADANQESGDADAEEAD